MKISIDAIIPNPQQPREYFDPGEIQSLANSIKEHGQLQPILVEESSGGAYILIDGERRWRACKLLGHTEIEASIHPPMDGSGSRERLVMALIANVQRQDLNPIEEAKAYQKMGAMGMSHNKISLTTGVSYPIIANRLELLRLDEEIQDLVAAGNLPLDSHMVYAFLSVRDREARIKIAEKMSAVGATLKAIIAACDRYNELLRRKSKETPPLEIPSIDLAVRHRKQPMSQPYWDALAQLGHLPPWKLVQERARTTCAACVLREVASEKSCKECPAVELISQLMEATDK